MTKEILTIIALLYIGFGSAVLVGYISKVNPKVFYLPILILLFSSITLLLIIRGGTC